MSTHEFACRHCYVYVHIFMCTCMSIKQITETVWGNFYLYAVETNTAGKFTHFDIGRNVSFKVSIDFYCSIQYYENIAFIVNISNVNDNIG